MTDESLTQKTASAAGAPFGSGRAEGAGSGQSGAHEEAHGSSQADLDAGYKAMASDTEREEEARAWCAALSGETLRSSRPDEAS